MAQRRQPMKPFYVLLIVTGLAFAITACGFGVMTFTDVQGPGILGVTGNAAADSGKEHPLFRFLDQYGMQLMLVELALLAVATVGCIAADTWYERRQVLEDSQQGQADAGLASTETDPVVESGKKSY